MALKDVVAEAKGSHSLLMFAPVQRTLPVAPALPRLRSYLCLLKRYFLRLSCRDSVSGGFWPKTSFPDVLCPMEVMAVRLGSRKVQITHVERQMQCLSFVFQICD
jgi:hypothetical protein